MTHQPRERKSSMTDQFTLQTKMRDVEIKFPFARSSLHSQFHIGGCSKCGYEPDDSIEEVAQKHSKSPTDVLELLNKNIEDMNQCDISIEKFLALKNSNEKILIVDVREEWEYNIAQLPHSVLLTEKNFEQMIHESKNVSHVIVVCHHGMRSMNATLYLREKGVLNAKSLVGGIDAYSVKVDNLIQRY